MTHPQNSDEREAFNTNMPTTAAGWAFALAEASNAAAKAKAEADHETYLPVVQAIQKQAIDSHRPKVSLEGAAKVIFESRYPFSWDIASERVLNENLYEEADQCRRDAKAILNHLKQLGVQFHETE